VPHAETAVADAFEAVFGKSPVVESKPAEPLVTVSAYVEASEASPAKLAKLRAALRPHLAKSGRISCQKVRREDWAESWKRHFKPLEIGPTLLIRPSWSKRKPRRDQALVVLDPGLSFGTGQHPTTWYCLRKIVEAMKPGASLLDIGCGSGILAISAAKLGYTPVEAFDFDPVPVRIAQANMRRNRVEQKIKCARKDLTKLPAKSAQKFDVVCANLIADLLIDESDRILNRLARNGRLIVAGILASQFGEVQEAYEAKGMELLDTKTEKEWQSGLFARA